MFREEIENVGNAAKGKTEFLRKNPLGYFLAAMLAGLYVGLGILFTLTAGAFFTQGNVPGAKVIMGACFGVALSLVIMAGSELFTGNNFVMTVGALQKKITWKQALQLWGVCWLGNLAGSILLAVLYHLTGLGNGATGTMIAETALAKMSVEPLPLFVRGVLCNVLVCVAVWCGIKMKSESGKLIMIFWCLLTFFASGFEHSIANMTVISTALLNPMEVAVTVGGFVYNLVIVTLGNMVGGILFLAVPYYLIGREQKNS
ncbi:MAG: formate/nitrite transporter family protein [Candidatus Ruminococcus intestinipullorum]|nr:formate/nitrite transporter family protein [Candidatus Ruminococcus intestinipullorum]